MKLEHPRSLGTYRIIENWGGAFIGLLSNRGIIAVALVYVARHSDVTNYGQYTSSFALASNLVILIALGLEPWLLTRGKFALSDVMGIWGNIMRIRGASLAIWILLMVLLATVLPHKTYPINIFIPLSISLAFESIAQLSFSALRCVNRNWAITFIQSASALLLLTVVLAFPDKTKLVILFAYSRALVSSITSVILLNLCGFSNVIRPKIVMATKDVLRGSKAFILSELSSIIYLKADIMIVGLLLGPRLSGLYSASSYLMQITYLVPQALYLTIVPLLATHFQSSNLSSFRRINSFQIFAQIIIGSLLFVTILFNSQTIVYLIFGEAYSEAILIVRLLSPIALLRSINFSLSATLISSQRQEKRAVFQISSALFNVVANLFVAKIFGLPGVAIVFVISEAILASGYSIALFTTKKSLELNKVNIIRQ